MDSHQAAFRLQLTRPAGWVSRGCGIGSRRRRIIRMFTLNANWIVMVLALGFGAFAQGAVGVELKADARWSLEFPDLPDTLATMTTGERKPARLTVRLPANYSRDGKFPLFVFLNGNDGGRGDTL